MFNSFESSPLYKCDSWVCETRRIVICSLTCRTAHLSFLLFRVILTYFHIECQRENEAKAKSRFDEVYVPDKTDVETKLPFMKKGTNVDEFSQGDCAKIITVQP